MAAIPGIKGYKENLSRKAALELVKEKKADGYKAFLESYTKVNRKSYRVIWY